MCSKHGFLPKPVPHFFCAQAMQTKHNEACFKLPRGNLCRDKDRNKIGLYKVFIFFYSFIFLSSPCRLPHYHIQKKGDKPAPQHEARHISQIPYSCQTQHTMLSALHLPQQILLPFAEVCRQCHVISDYQVAISTVAPVVSLAAQTHLRAVLRLWLYL